MTDVLLKKLQTAKSFINDGEFSRAKEILNRIDLEQYSFVVGEYYLLLAQTQLSLGELDHDFAEKAIAIYRDSIDHVKYAQAKYLRGWQLQALGQNIESIESLNEAYSSIIRSTDSSTLPMTAKILSRLSYIQYKSGNIEQAILNLEKCVKIGKSIGDDNKVFKMQNNIAQIYLSSGQLNKALKIFEDNHSRLSGDMKALCNSTLSLSMTYALLGETEKALNLIESRQDIFEDFKHQQFIYYEYYGQILMTNNQVDKAIEQLQTGYELAKVTAPDSDMISQIGRQLADAYLIKGDINYSRELTNIALNVAEKINERVEIAACWRNLAILNNEKSNFDKSLNLFQRIQSNYELAVTRVKAAQSGSYSEAQSKVYLSLALDYFKTEDVIPYIVAISNILNPSAGKTPNVRDYYIGAVCLTSSKSSHSN